MRSCMKVAPSLSSWTARVRSRSACEKGISSAIRVSWSGKAYLRDWRTGAHPSSWRTGSTRGGGATLNPMPEKPPFSLTVALLTVGRVWEAAFERALKPLGLTTRKYGLLGHIRATPGISFSELARRSQVTVQSAHTAVQSLVADGLVA